MARTAGGRAAFAADRPSVSGAVESAGQAISAAISDTAAALSQLSNAAASVGASLQAATEH